MLITDTGTGGQGAEQNSDDFYPHRIFMLVGCCAVVIPRVVRNVRKRAELERGQKCCFQ